MFHVEHFSIHFIRDCREWFGELRCDQLLSLKSMDFKSVLAWMGLMAR